MILYKVFLDDFLVLKLFPGDPMFLLIIGGGLVF